MRECMRERQRYGQMETEADRKTDREPYLPHMLMHEHTTHLENAHLAMAMATLL